jgi:hypothetical protein
MHQLIQRYIQSYGYELTIKDKSRASVTLIARLISPSGHTITGEGISVEHAVNALIERLLKEDAS